MQTVPLLRMKLSEKSNNWLVVVADELAGLGAVVSVGRSDLKRSDSAMVFLMKYRSGAVEKTENKAILEKKYFDLPIHSQSRSSAYCFHNTSKGLV